MTAQERPSFQIPEITWPTEVTTVDLDKIRDYRGQGISLGASVAGAIRDEGKTTLIPPIKAAWSAMGCPRDPKDWPQDLSDNLLAVGSYIELAGRFIGAEKHIWRGEPIPTSPEVEKAFEELITDAFSFDNFVIPNAARRAVEEELPFEEAVEKQVNTLEEVLTAVSVDNELQKQHIRHLFETGTPLDVIDYLALLAGEKWRDTDYEKRPVLDAIEHCRQRFHDLYNEAQKQL